MEIQEELKSAGVYPTGPVSAWPRSRNDALLAGAQLSKPKVVHATDVKATSTKMVTGLLKTAGQAIKGGRVSQEIRDERYETCKSCPAFIEASKRCSDCGCFMEAKTWVNGDKAFLCPQNKWSR